MTPAPRSITRTLLLAALLNRGGRAPIGEILAQIGSMSGRHLPSERTGRDLLAHGIVSITQHPANLAELTPVGRQYLTTHLPDVLPIAITARNLQRAGVMPSAPVDKHLDNGNR